MHVLCVLISSDQRMSVTWTVSVYRCASSMYALLALRSLGLKEMFIYLVAMQNYGIQWHHLCTPLLRAWWGYTLGRVTET